MAWTFQTTNMRRNLGVPSQDAPKKTRVIDLDVDIGADAVDYKFVFCLVLHCFTSHI